MRKMFLYYSLIRRSKKGDATITNPASVSLSVQQVADTSQLGTLQAQYATRTSYPFISGGFFALIVGCIIVYCLPDFLQFVGIAWIVAGGAIVLFSLIRPKIVVFVYSEGLVQLKKSEIEVLRWEQVEALRKQIMTYRKIADIREYKISRTDGGMFVFGNSIPDVKTLGIQIEQATARVLLPQFIARYHNGNLLSFEAISVSLQGIRLVQGKKFLFWHECEGSFTNDDMFYVYKSGQKSAWASLSVSTLPNAAALKELINHILYERAVAILPHILVDYRADFPTMFGALNLNMQGVSVHGELFQPWEEISNINIDLDKRQVSIYLHDSLLPWQRLPTWMTPNVFLLKAFAEAVMQVYASA